MDIDDQLQICEDSKHSGDSYDEIAKIAISISMTAQTCKEKLPEHIITCCSDYTFHSHAVSEAIGARDRAVQAEIDARKDLGFR